MRIENGESFSGSCCCGGGESPKLGDNMHVKKEVSVEMVEDT